MSTKLIKAMTDKMIRRVAIREPMKYIAFDDDVSHPEMVVEHSYEYKVEARFGGLITCTAGGLPAAKRDMIRMLIEEIYGEMRQKIIEMNIAYGYEYDHIKGQVLFNEVMGMMEPEL